jgi:hypothetical protein
MTAGAPDLGRRPMPLTSVGSQAWRNLCTGTSRPLTFASTLALALSLLAWADVASAATLAGKVHAFVASGASTYTLISDANIDGAACEGLVSSGYAEAAGGLRTGGDTRLRALPDNPVGVYEATPGLLGLIAPDRPHPDSTGVYLAPALADDVAPVLNHRPGEGVDVPVLVAPMTALGTYPWPDDGRPAQLQYAVLGAVRPVGAFDQCWVRSVDPTADPRFLLRSTLIRTPTDPDDAQVAQLNPRLGESLAATAEFGSRPNRLAWVVSLGVGFLLAAASVWLRRVELAGGREVGMATVAQLTQILLETLAWALAGALLAAPLLMARAAQGAPVDRLSLMAVGVPVLMAGAAGSLIGSITTAALVRRRPVISYLRTR